jgi:cytochrome P450
MRHGVIRYLMLGAARAGELHSVLTTDPRVRENPYPVYEKVRARGSVVRGPLTTMVVGHREASLLLRSPDFLSGLHHEGVPKLLQAAFSRSPGRIVGPIDRPSMLVENAPEHTRYRSQVARVFTARAIAELEDEIVSSTNRLLDELEGQREIDLVAQFASLLPVTVICQILGIPIELRGQFLEWGNSASFSLDLGLKYREFQHCERGVRGLNEWMYGHIERLRRNPGDDLLSRMIMADDDGNRMSDRELMATVNLVLAAGFETTVNLISAGVSLLSRHPQELALLQADPSLWVGAVDEVLRFEAPVQETMRIAARDTTLAGIRFRRGEVIGVIIGAANRDPAVFARPARFDVRRPNARDHLAFSAGAHFCLGSALARLEGRIALSAFFNRFPQARIAGRETWRPTRTLRGLESLPIRLGPARGMTANDSYTSVGVAPSPA